MDKKTLVKLAGGTTRLARLLGISKPAIYMWQTVPEARMWQLQVLKPEWFKKGQDSESNQQLQ